MGYLHIENLYKNQQILAFKECYALEKVHGTSAHVRWTNGKVTLSSGGASGTTFAAIFDVSALAQKFVEIGHPEVVVYGEAYGGKEQGMRATYGDRLQFIVFDVQIGDLWLSVTKAHAVVEKLGLVFVPYERVPATVEALDAERDRFSRVAQRVGIEGKHAEGVVCRPLEEYTTNNGERVICKHKRQEFQERATMQPVVDPAFQQVLEDAQSIAQEWVTPMRLLHVLQKMPEVGQRDFAKVIAAMQEDVLREAKGEITVTREATKAIGTATSKLFAAWLKDQMVKTK